jgi:hypothetical protein
VPTSAGLWFLSVLRCSPIVAWCAGQEVPEVGDAGIKHVISGVDGPMMNRMRATVDEYP